MPFLEHNGWNIHYELCGGGPDAPAVILHHGLTQWAEDWRSAGWLGVFRGMQVMVFDALGHGWSSRPREIEGYRVEQRAETVLALADAVGFERFTFFGFSMGGRVGFELAAKAPHRLDALVVGGMHGLRADVDRVNLERRAAALRSAKWRMVERAVGVRDEDGRNNEQEPLALSTEAVLEWPGAEAALPGVKAPVLMFCGQGDSLLEYARRTAALMPHCRLVELPGTGHAASFYTSAEAKRAVEEFVRGTGG
jgi:pimeloyl-ACP methyl ester carboxylesterase